jgi:hypothetical protein
MITAFACVCVCFTHVRSYRSPANDDYAIIRSHNAQNYSTLLGLHFECAGTRIHSTGVNNPHESWMFYSRFSLGACDEKKHSNIIIRTVYVTDT